MEAELLPEEETLCSICSSHEQKQRPQSSLFPKITKYLYPGLLTAFRLPVSQEDPQTYNFKEKAFFSWLSGLTGFCNSYSHRARILTRTRSLAYQDSSSGKAEKIDREFRI